jgi:predicted esterase
MKHIISHSLVSLLVIVLATSLAFCAEPSSQAGPASVPVIKDAQPVIDGVLDDPAWQTAMVFDAFKPADGQAPKGNARMLVTQDDQNLYIAIESFEDAKDLSSLIAKVKEHDGANMWSDDEVELFIDPSNQRKSFYQIAINSKGVTWDAYIAQPGKQGAIPDVSWNPTYKSAAKVGEKSWIVELALPWSSFDSTSKFASDWGFDALIMRQEDEDRQKVGEELWFVPIKGNAQQPAKFGTLSGLIGLAPATIVDRQVVMAIKPDPTTEPWFPKFEAREFTGSDGKVLLYRMVRPTNATPGVKTPVLIYLHGGGLRGDNNIDQVPEFHEQMLEGAEQYGALSIDPQCPEFTGWVADASRTPRRPGATSQADQAPAAATKPSRQSAEPLKLLAELIPSLEKEFNLDFDRVYIVGGSMGAAGTWTMLDAYPDMFAAAVVRSGRGDPSKAFRFAHVPVWLAHGDKDKTVPVEGSREMVKALKQAGGNPRYNEFHGLGHSGMPIEPELMPWLFAQRKSAQVKHLTPTSSPASEPAK